MIVNEISLGIENRMTKNIRIMNFKPRRTCPKVRYDVDNEN